MRNLLILFFIAALTSFAHAQVDFGIKTFIGFNTANEEYTFSGDILDNINHEITYKKSNLIKSYGIFVQQKAGFLFIRSELAFTHFRQEYEVRSFEQLQETSRTSFEKFEFIDFRVMGGVTQNNVRLGVGPITHILVGNDDKMDFISGYNENHRGVTFGFLFTIGYDLDRLHLDLRYENNFRTVGEHIYYGNRSAGFNNKPHSMQFVVGISI